MNLCGKKNEELENKIQRISEEKEKFACEKAGKQVKTTRKTTNTLGTKPTTGLQAQVNDLENTVKELRKQMREQEKRFSEAIKKENSKSDSLEEKGRGLTETIRPGSKCLVWLLPHCKSWYKNLDFVWDFLILKKDCQQAYVSFLWSKSCLDFNK